MHEYCMSDWGINTALPQVHNGERSDQAWTCSLWANAQTQQAGMLMTVAMSCKRKGKAGRLKRWTSSLSTTAPSGGSTQL